MYWEALASGQMMYESLQAREHRLSQLRQKSMELLQQEVASQPTTVVMDSLELKLEGGVFPPHIGSTTKLLADTAVTYMRNNKINSALDMGTGSGYIACRLLQQGVSVLIATDNDPRACETARKNINSSKYIQDIAWVLHGDLCDALIGPHFFDMQVFNHPYYPHDIQVAGVGGADAGEQILNRYFASAHEHALKGNVALLPYSEFAGDAHDPKRFAPRKYWKRSVVAKSTDDWGKHRIYQFTRK